MERIAAASFCARRGCPPQTVPKGSALWKPGPSAGQRQRGASAPLDSQAAPQLPPIPDRQITTADAMISRAFCNSEISSKMRPCC